MYGHSETALLNACRTLFGKEVNLSGDFLNYLQPSGAKLAFRNQAKAHHPDLHAGSSRQIREQQTERFREIRQAYDLLIDFLETRHRRRLATPPPRSTQRPKARASRAPARRSQCQAPARPVPVPSIPLEFGMYTFYQGKVSYQQLIEALVWQRRQRPALGVIAQRWGWLSEAKVAEVLGHRGRTVRFGKKAVELGYLNARQVEALLQHQRSQQMRIGEYFVRQGLMTAEEADQIAGRLKDHNRQLSRRAKNPHHRR